MREASIQLRPKELVVCEYIARGYTAKEIARELKLSFRTVEHYTDKVKDKFSVGSKRLLMRKLMELNDYQRMHTSL